eukprot:Skav222806  [mRNA]  locus=scaffold1444:30228:31373:- [translate_table: standard]
MRTKTPQCQWKHQRCQCELPSCVALRPFPDLTPRSFEESRQSHPTILEAEILVALPGKACRPAAAMSHQLA